MVMLIVGLCLFLGMHSVAFVAPGLKAGMQAKLGVMGWKGVYALVSLIGFVLIVIGYGEARYDTIYLYYPPAWTRHIAALLMIFVFPFLLAAYLPGKIQSTLKHPMLVATKTWALAHLIANGSLADVLLFGSFLVWAVVDRISLKRRVTVKSPKLPQSKLNDVIVVVLGLVLYVGFAMWGHKTLIGIPPFGI